MKKLSKQAVAGVALASMLVTGLASSSFAKSGVTKNRSFTGVIQSVDGNRSITVSRSKKGTEVFPLTGKTRIVEEQKGRVGSLKSGQIVEVSGKGQGNQLIAKKITLLATESFRQSKQVKSGNAYGSDLKKTTVKAKVVTSKPLVLMNRNQQELKVVLDKVSNVIVQVSGTAAALAVGKKVTIEYVEVKGKIEVKQIIVKLPKTKKQAKK